MSRSYTVKPAVAHSRGRGRGVTASGSTQSTAGGDRGRGATARSQTDRLTTRYAQTDMDQNQEELRDGGTGQEQRMSHHGAFTMISPNEKKRREITEQARREVEAYQRHKESNRLGPVSYVGTVGGGQKTQNDVRNQQARVQQSSKFDSVQKRQAARDIVKKREEEENLKKKTEQRRKAEQNQRSEVDRQQKLKEDHRQKNETFLRRIEAEQKSKSTSKYRQPAAVKEPADDDTVQEGSQAAMNTPLDDRHDSELRELQQMFPMYDQETLRDILSQAGSVDDAVQLLN